MHVHYFYKTDSKSWVPAIQCTINLGLYISKFVIRETESFIWENLFECKTGYN